MPGGLLEQPGPFQRLPGLLAQGPQQVAVTGGEVAVDRLGQRDELAGLVAQAEHEDAEPPGVGDPWRGRGPLPGRTVDYYWQLTSRNKRSLAIDLKHADGIAALHKLIAWKDAAKEFKRLQKGDYPWATQHGTWSAT